MTCDQDELTSLSIRFQHAKIRDHGSEILARDSRNEIHLLDECTPRMFRYHKNFLRQLRDFRRAAGAGQPDLRPLIVSGHGRIEIAETIDLRCPKKSHID